MRPSRPVTPSCISSCRNPSQFHPCGRRVLFSRIRIMAQEFKLLQQPAAAGKAISEATFQVLQDYFRTAGNTAAATRAAQAVASRVPKDEDDAVEGFLWTFWADVTEVAKQIPHDDPAQDKLVAVVRELRLLPDAGVKVGNVRRAPAPSSIRTEN